MVIIILKMLILYLYLSSWKLSFFSFSGERLHITVTTQTRNANKTEETIKSRDLTLQSKNFNLSRRSICYYTPRVVSIISP